MLEWICFKLCCLLLGHAKVVDQYVDVMQEENIIYVGVEHVCARCGMRQ